MAHTGGHGCGAIPPEPMQNFLRSLLCVPCLGGHGNSAPSQLGIFIGGTTCKQGRLRKWPSAFSRQAKSTVQTSGDLRDLQILKVCSSQGIDVQCMVSQCAQLLVRPVYVVDWHRHRSSPKRINDTRDPGLPRIGRRLHAPLYQYHPGPKPPRYQNVN